MSPSHPRRPTDVLAALAFLLALSTTAHAAPSPSLQGRESGVWNIISDNDLNPDQAVTDFGDVNVGASFDRRFRLRNIGDGFFNWTGASSTDGQFEILNTGGTTQGFPIPIVGGNNREFIIRFTPTDPGTTKPTITLTTNLSSLNAEYTFAVTATGVAPDARLAGRQGSSGSYVTINDGDTSPRLADGTDFNFIPVGSSAVRHFRLTNTGNATLDPGSAFFVGGNSGDFSISGLSFSNLGAGNSRDFTITFTPSSTGVKTTTLHFVSDDPDENPYTFALTGEGVAFPNIQLRGLESGFWNDIDDADLNPDQAVTQFDPVSVGKSSTRSFRIENTGNATLNVSSVTSSKSEFTIPGPPTSVPPGDSRDFVITFKPTSAGASNTTITVRSNAPGDDDPYTFALTGTGLVPDARLSGRPSTSSGFDNITDGETTPRTSEGTLFVMTPVGNFSERFFKLTNDGNSPLDPSGAFFSGPDADQFDIRNLSLADLNPSKFREFEIRFAPTSQGTKSATFNLVSDDPDENPYTFTVQGVAVAFPNINVRGREDGFWNDIADADLDPDQAVTRYGDVDLGQSGTRLFRIENTGNATLNITSITSNSSRFTIPGPPATVPPGDDTDFVIDFTPTTRATTNATITIVSDTPGDEATYTFALTGTGVGPEIVVEWQQRLGNWINITDGSSTTDPRNGTLFRDTDVSGDSSDHTFRVSNTGNKNLRISGRSFTGSGASQFSVSGLLAGNPFADIGTTKGRTFTITFNPSSEGSKLATFSIDNNDGDEDPFTFAVQGTGIAEPDIRVAGITEVGGVRIPSEITDGDLVPDQDVTRYGEVNPGTTATRIFRIYNDGDANLDISSITSSTPTFSIPGPPVLVKPNKHTDFVIDFAPTYTGPVNPVITITSDDPDAEGTYTFALTGTGDGPQIQLHWTDAPDIPIADGDQAPASADGTILPAVAIAGGQVTHTFEIENPGSGVLSISGITVDPPSHFQVSSTPPIVGAGASETFDLTFDPTAPGWHQTTVTIHSNASTPFDVSQPEPPAADYTFAVSSYGWDNVSARLRIEGQPGAGADIFESGIVIDLYPDWQEIDDDDPDVRHFNGTDLGTEYAWDGPPTLWQNFNPFGPDYYSRNESFFRISNDGAEPVFISLIEIDSDHYRLDLPQPYRGEPSFGRPVGATIAPGDHYLFSVTFHPWLFGPQDARITVHSDAPDETNIIRISGFADVPNDGPELVLQELDYTLRAEFGTTRDFAIPVGNAGNETLIISTPSSSAPAILQVLSAPAKIAPGATGTIVVRYQPSAPNSSEEATISFVNNDPDGNENPETIRFRCWGSVPSIYLDSASGENIPNGTTTTDPELGTDFGTSTPGEAPAVHTFTIFNYDSFATLDISSVSTTSASFHIESYPGSLDPQGDGALIISYHPAAAGDEQATISINSDDPDDTPYTFTVQGTSPGIPAPPDIVFFETLGSSIYLGFTNSPTETYTIYSSSDQVTWVPSPFHSNIPGTGAVIHRTLVGYAFANRRFVRVGQDP